MAEITTVLGTTDARRIHLRRGRLTCCAGRDAGTSWLVDRDVVRLGSQPGNDVVLSDDAVSRRHAEIVRLRDGVVLRDLGSTNGTFVGPIRVREVYLAADTRFQVGESELRFSPEDEVIDVPPWKESRFEDMVGRSEAMRTLFGLLERVARTDLTVLVTGETGTGKELVSRALHHRSRRASGPFVVFDCGAVSNSLVESELFGHERGAFTGAVAGRRGVFELADRGTLFLDEIGDLPLVLQPKLLRALEQREVRRVGGSRILPVDVRVVAATHRDLKAEVAAGRFREDLYYRLAVVELGLPALRDRLEDLGLLADHILNRASPNPGVTRVAPEVLALFEAYRWPGNVRELRNVLERALPFTSGPILTLAGLPEALRAASGATGPDTAPAGVRLADRPFKDAKEQMIEAFERQYLVDLLARHRGNVSRAARAAAMDRKSIARLMKKHHIER
ncbi:MAG: sigma 54-dependent Fis family transcriptional regulator [Deltaproteobacteria bacterium]|nr:sigma 54-dependent Fis family transcriptional regulator [Deltaproteobacteria bacterium]